MSAARSWRSPPGGRTGFELAAFWARWSAEFEASRPRLEVRLAASPGALAAFGEVFGAAAAPALEAAEPPGQDGWRVVTPSFEHERAAVHRLAGFGDQVEILDPPSVRAELLATAREILGAATSPAADAHFGARRCPAAPPRFPTSPGHLRRDA